MHLANLLCDWLITSREEDTRDATRRKGKGPGGDARHSIVQFVHRFSDPSFIGPALHRFSAAFSCCVLVLLLRFRGWIRWRWLIRRPCRYVGDIRRVRDLAALGVPN